MFIPTSVNESAMGVFAFSLISFIYVATQIALPAFTSKQLVRKIAKDNIFSIAPVISLVAILLLPSINLYETLYFYIAIISIVLIIDLWLIGTLQGRIQYLKSEISSEE